MSKCLDCHDGCFTISLFLVDELPLYHWTDSAAHLERVHRGEPVTANEGQVSYSRSSLAEGETLRGKERG